MTTDARAAGRPLPVRRTHPVERVARPARKAHPAAGSRVATLALSVAATVGMIAAMAGAQNGSSVTTVDSQAQPPASGPAVVTVPRSQILLPVPNAAQVAPTTTVPRATPQPIVLTPKRSIVVVRSNGSR